MTPLLVGNWKMHKTAAQSAAYVDALRALEADFPEGAVVAIAPPFTALAETAERLRGSRIELAAQNVHWARSGAFTGEISAEMLIEFGVRYAIVGHSERRAYFGETDAGVHDRARAALDAGITPILCVGETLAERDAGEAHARVTAQTRAALDGFEAGDVARVVVAYEPIWAIGTGRNCDPDEADAAMALIRGSVHGLERARVLYGGSVKAENVAAYTCKPNVDGGLVGGASLDPHDFATLIRNAAEGTSRR